MKYLLLIITLIAGLSSVLNANAAVVSEVVEYKQGDTVLEGYLSYDDAISGKRPGILIVPEWKGIGPYAERRTKELAKLGYIAFAADIYGKGVRPQTGDEASKIAAIYKSDRKLMRARVTSGLDVLKNHKLTDTKRIAAIGYCFGGTTVLELARSSADIAGVVSFHGGLDTPTPEDAKQIKARVLALHGGDDPFVTAEHIAAFEDEMKKGGVDWQLHVYGGAVHSFTVTDAGNDPSKGAAYNERADKRSWEDMKVFFAEIFR
ncbi:MAG: dienelactone hydrolase family protein [Nitrospirae bacterium]|nr:dienelactone hydrolase family protein [Nitrospirota bacterium]